MKRRSYLEVLKSKHTQEKVHHFKQNFQKTKKKLSVMIHNLPPQATNREIWIFLNKRRMIRGIILPKKTDKNNYMIGFMMVLGQDAANALMKEHNNTTFMGHILQVKMAKRNSTTSKAPTTVYEKKNFVHPKSQPNLNVQI